MNDGRTYAHTCTLAVFKTVAYALQETPRPTTLVEVRVSNPLMLAFARARSATAGSSKTPITDEPDPAKRQIAAP